jgi:hypothetical protein
MLELSTMWCRPPKTHPLAVDATQDIDEELMFHFRSLVQENMARNMPTDDAWADAQKRFGSIQQYAKETRSIDMGNRFTIQRVALFMVFVLCALCGWLWFQVEQLHGQNTQIMHLVQDKQAPEKPDMTSYPIQLPADAVRTVAKLSVDFGKLQMNGDDIAAIPVTCERGTTGIVLIGNGTFHYAPEADKKFEGRFHAAWLRFNPKDLDKILKLDNEKKTDDKGAYEMARALLPRAVNHSWQSNGDALIPPEQTFSAVLNSPQYGDLLISAGPKDAVVYDFTDQKSLYEKK